MTHQIIIIRRNCEIKSLFIDIAFYQSKDLIHEWKLNEKKISYRICVYADKSGSVNTINQYELPPPIDKDILYGDIIVVAYKKINHVYKKFDLNVDSWSIFYNRMFMFENLRASQETDEHEIDELLLVPLNKKTKDGYLKDGFVVDDDDDDTYH